MCHIESSKILYENVSVVLYYLIYHLFQRSLLGVTYVLFRFGLINFNTVKLNFVTFFN